MLVLTQVEPSLSCIVESITNQSGEPGSIGCAGCHRKPGTEVVL